MMSVLLLPLLACLFLVFIHVFFGAFVIRRGILFIDLALAQWAALGYVVGISLNIETPAFLFLMGLSFTFLAAVFLTVLKPLYQQTHLQEAVIGVMYITAVAIATALISSTGLDSHHLEEMLVGHLLFVQGKDVVFSIGLYLIVGVLLYVFRHQIMRSSSRRWDFVFYALFGCVVASSVKMVGVLLVFSFLVIPILSVTLLTSDLRRQILLGWFIGVGCTVIGLLASFWVDIPPSYCIILSLSLMWVLMTMGLLFKHQKAFKN